MTSFKLLHVSAPGCHPWGVVVFITKEHKPNTLILVLHCPYWNDGHIKIL